MQLPNVPTPAEADQIQRPKAERLKANLPDDLEEQAVRFMTLVNEVIKKHWNGTALLVPTGSIHNEALKMCEEHLAKSGWSTKRTKDGADWLLKLMRDPRQQTTTKARF